MLVQTQGGIINALVSYKLITDNASISAEDVGTRVFVGFVVAELPLIAVMLGRVFTAELFSFVDENERASESSGLLGVERAVQSEWPIGNARFDSLRFSR